MINEALLKPLKSIRGDFGIWFESPDNTVSFNPDTPFVAASVIKLGVMLAAFEAEKTGKISFETEYCVKEADKLPSCGALTYMHTGLNVTLMDLITLMIILSDNSATNILIKLMSIEYINSVLNRYGLCDIVLRRLLFDSVASSKGIENTVTARSVASFYRQLLNKTLVSEEASEKMLDILFDQRLNGKMPFFLHPRDIDVAHKTGEDEGISHDTGIILAPSPIIAVFLSGNSDVPAFERYIQDTALTLTL